MMFRKSEYMGKRNKSNSFWSVLFDSTQKKVLWVLSVAWIVFRELILDRLTGWGNTMIDKWLASHPSLIADILSWIFKDAFHITSAIALIIILIMVMQAWKETKGDKDNTQTPNMIAHQLDDGYYHFRIQRLVTGTDKKDEPEFVFNSRKASFLTVATKLQNGQTINIAGVPATGIEINSGVIGLIVLHSKVHADTASLGGANAEIKEQFWHELRYRPDVVDITAELDISNQYAR